ncbi:CDP-alcohol phosphatidyltransferase family protein [Ilyobacter polytropus]|uniref:CDP-alcohol phosphatidyltransferase n=1 Tax=Ilyobacter polytropus (strain ATCC 51220 / DSM 2926 / LMG 16218 / CuHBu1) TaxID=572544 RepID=E3HD45_ILYPC|nr:CDP-alcohol phosphatidyltransferase family protein [Ilyobacter polytropus]ADO84521.1 CDP-alcohol phosphatidyltransferase [Ilyobacter polytropus DSM 2926]
MLDTHARKHVQPIIEKVADFFMRYNFTANQVTVMAFFMGISTGIFIYFKMPLMAIAVLWLSGLLDAVDGTIARENGSTPFGTVMDITFDRLVEISVILGLAFRFSNTRMTMLILTCSIIFSMTVFLTTGMMAEKKGSKSFYYQAGVAERTEGFIFFTMMMLFTKYINPIGVVFLSAVIFTASQRLLEARKILG